MLAVSTTRASNPRICLSAFLVLLLGPLALVHGEDGLPNQGGDPLARTSLLCSVTLACVIGVGPASAQSLRDIVKNSEGGRMPTQAEWQQRAAGGDARAQAPAPNVVPAPAETVPPAVSPRSTLTTTCEPPGMPAPTQLVSVAHQTLIAPVEGTLETVAVTAIGLVTKDHLARYRLGEMPLDFIIYFVRGHVAAVDDHPGDPSEPDLVDTGMVSPRGAALAQGRPMCRWERLSRTRNGDDTATTRSRI